MSTIRIENLNSVGSDLFSDQETYLNELTNEESDFIKGGGTPIFSAVTAVIISFNMTYQFGKATAEIWKASRK
jgi:hypothetical protein